MANDMNYNMDPSSSWHTGAADKICTHCGAETEDDFLFCQICGTRLENSKAARQKALEKKRRKKKAIILTVSIIAASLFAIYLGFFLANYGEYKKACDDLESGNYHEAYRSFVELDGFMDSDEMIIETIYRNADDLLQKGEYDEAIKQFTNIDYYKDSKTKVSECKYSYVLANKSNKNELTYSYITELKEENYKDSAEVYKDIYRWRAKGIINTTKDDYKTHSTSVSRYSKYVHFSFLLEGGLPGEKVELKYKLIYTNGSTFENKEIYVKYEGETVEGEWDNGLHENPDKMKAGTMTIELYNADTNDLIGSVSTEIK